MFSKSSVVNITAAMVLQRDAERVTLELTVVNLVRFCGCLSVEVH